MTDETPLTTRDVPFAMTATPGPGPALLRPRPSPSSRTSGCGRAPGRWRAGSRRSRHPGDYVTYTIGDQSLIVLRLDETPSGPITTSAGTGARNWPGQADRFGVGRSPARSTGGAGTSMAPTPSSTGRGLRRDRSPIRSNFACPKPRSTPGAAASSSTSIPMQPHWPRRSTRCRHCSIRWASPDDGGLVEGHRPAGQLEAGHGGLHRGLPRHGQPPADHPGPVRRYDPNALAYSVHRPRPLELHQPPGVPRRTTAARSTTSTRSRR